MGRWGAFAAGSTAGGGACMGAGAGAGAAAVMAGSAALPTLI